jgi:glycosyltransferase involved in cell wall biosynthesis
MKIAYVAGAIIPSKTANSIQVMKMCQAFKSLKHNVVLIVSDRKTNEIATEDINIYEFYGVMDVFEISKVFWPSLPYGGFLFGLLAALKAKKSSCDIVYSRHLAGAFFATCFEMPTYFEAHKPVSNPIAKYLFSRMTKNNSFKRLVVISNSLKEYFLRNYCLSPLTVFVSPDAAEPFKEIPDLKDILNKGRLQAGYIGHLYPGKGMEMISEFASRCPSVDFNVIGGLDSDINKWKKRTEKLSNLIFHGYIPHGEIEKHIGQFHILMAPFMENVGVNLGGKTDIGRWMSPLKIFEYMSAGRPILCSDLPVLREILINDYTAIMLPPGDVETWVKTIKELENDHQRMIMLSLNAKRIFKLKYTWLARAENIMNATIFDLIVSK